MIDPVVTSANEEPIFIDVRTNHNFKRGIFNAIIAPRPIGWISTLNANGKANLAPFSYFNIVSNHPPILMFSCNEPEDREWKDTAVNVRATGEFVFNLVGLDLVEPMNQTSTPVPPDVDEFEFAGIAKAMSRVVAPPRVAASACSLECKVVRVLNFGGGEEGPTTTVTFGEVVAMHIAPGFVANGRFLTEKANPVARLGGAEYGVCEKTFNLERKFTRANEGSY